MLFYFETSSTIEYFDSKQSGMCWTLQPVVRQAAINVVFLLCCLQLYFTLLSILCTEQFRTIRYPKIISHHAIWGVTCRVTVEIC